MTVFWILAAGLSGLALLFVLPPLFSQHKGADEVDQDELNLAVFRHQLEELDRDLAGGEIEQQQYDAARRDLERELLHDVEGSDKPVASDAARGRLTAALLGLSVPAAAVSLYLYLGESAIIPRLEAVASGQVPAASSGAGGQMPPLEVMVQRLADKLEQEPDNLQGWTMLGRTYLAVGQPSRALQALEKAYGLAPEDPDVLVAYAESIAANEGRELAGRPAELIRTALRIDPDHVNARWLQGLIEFQGSNYVQAAEQWSALAETFDPESQEAGELARYIAEARGRAGKELAAPDRSSTSGAAQEPPPDDAQAAIAEKEKEGEPDTSSRGVAVEVSLTESLWPEADVKDTVFVYAKAVSGPPMPLAVHRAQVADLPLSVTLDDSMAMMPAMKLSAFPEVIVGARISKSGQATPGSGDLEGEAGPVKAGQAGTVKILIDRTRP